MQRRAEDQILLAEHRRYITAWHEITTAGTTFKTEALWTKCKVYARSDMLKKNVASKEEAEDQHYATLRIALQYCTYQKARGRSAMCPPFFRMRWLPPHLQQCKHAFKTCLTRFHVNHTSVELSSMHAKHPVLQGGCMYARSTNNAVQTVQQVRDASLHVWSVASSASVKRSPRCFSRNQQCSHMQMPTVQPRADANSAAGAEAKSTAGADAKSTATCKCQPYSHVQMPAIQQAQKPT
eukprot:scaffold36331_cov22-Tisochrysis_lutea.AAC.1